MATITARWASDSARNIAGDKAALILSTAQAAANDWGKYLQTRETIVLEIGIGDTGGSQYLANGGPNWGWNGQWHLNTPIIKARDGVDVNRDMADGRVTLGVEKWNNYFYDPSPKAIVPTNEVDEYSIFLHEFGHALGFVGISYANDANGNAVFEGPNTTEVRGGPFQLDGTRSHLPAWAGGSNIMDPYTGQGTRNWIGTLDLAVFQDIGMPIATERADRIQLGSADDRFSSFGGDDKINGGEGND